MATTVIPAGHALARKVYGAAVFAEYVKAPGWGSRITGPAPKMAETAKKLERMQTSKNYPCVRVTDLSREAGDTVTVDLFNILQGKPVMGDERLVGKGMKISSNTQEIKINQMRAMVEPGGEMTRQRTVHNLRTVGVAGLGGWFARTFDQLKLVHAAGARGNEDGPDWNVPLESDADFSKIVVNPIVPPTTNRQLFAGGRSGIAALTTTDILTLDDIDRLRSAIYESLVDTQPVRLPGDPAADDEFLYVLWVTNRQWHYLQNRTGEKAWRTFLQNARERGASNPLFHGTPGMWNGILVKKLPRPIRFYQNTDVTVTTNDQTLTTGTVAVPDFDTSGLVKSTHAVDRAILMGAQAIAEVFGKHGQSGMPMSWHEEVVDHGNAMEISGATMGGMAKLRFKDSTGTFYDHGIWTLDSYAPDPLTVTVA